MDHEISTIRSPKMKHLEKQFYSLEELSKFFQAATTDEKCLAIISLLLFIGLQPVEICRIMLEDIDFDNHYLTIYSRTRTRSYQLPMPPVCYDIIICYIALYGRQEGLLFLTKSGQPISVRHIRQVIERISKVAQIRRVSVRDLRRCYNTHAFRGIQSSTDKTGVGHGGINSYVNQRHLKCK